MSTKEDRIEIHSSAEERKELEEGAALAKIGLSEFIKLSAQFYAKALKDEHQNITLSKEEGVYFFQLLENPPASNAYLKNAMQKHE